MKEEAFTKFWSLIQAGILIKDCLPNTSPNYTESQEKKDYQNYVQFINSSSYDEYMNNKVDVYYGI